MDWFGYYQREWEDPESTAFWSRDEYYGHGFGDDDEDDEETEEWT